MAILMVPHRDLIQGLVSLATTLAIMSAALFLSAGTLHWPRGLAFLAAFFILVLVSMAWLWRVNPEIFAVRRGGDRRRHQKLGPYPDFDFIGFRLRPILLTTLAIVLGSAIMIGDLSGLAVLLISGVVVSTHGLCNSLLPACVEGKAKPSSDGCCHPVAAEAQ